MAKSSRFALVLLLGTVACAHEIDLFYRAPAVEASEPVALTFFPTLAANLIQTRLNQEANAEKLAIEKSRVEKIDRIEDMERSAYQINPKSDRKNLVIIVVDALRPDHLGIYGYERDTTPNLRALQKSGMTRQVSGMRSSCAQSRCGLLSLTSSKFVHQLSNRPFTLQQVLKQHGYRIHMILGGDPQQLWKFWINMKTQQQYAFNLVKDPHERNNAIDSLPAEYLRTLRFQLMQLRSVGTGER